MATILSKPQTDIIIFDDLNPEAAAMALAMYSRDPRSVRVHLEQIRRVGYEKFMAQYYVGYGHKSIGDCGSTTICFENISMLAAKAVQRKVLYRGQEASTRYLDMAEQAVLNPLGTKEGELIQETWMELYVYTLSKLIPYLMEKYPILPGENPKVYEKAIKAKAFDISRAYLPAGCTTYVGWHTDLRQGWDNLKEMSFHPLKEVRDLALNGISELQKKYTSSFGFKSYPEQDAYLEKSFFYNFNPDCQEFKYTHTIDPYITYDAGDLLSSRPQKTELPDWFNRYGQFYFEFLLDFGSFRDLQRHRSCTQLMPALTIDCGFNKWYLDSLPEDLRNHALEVISAQEARIKQIEDPVVRQYYVAMGYNVTCDMTAGLPSAVYIAELRSSQAVHPTLRVIAQKMGKALKETIPDMALYCDMSGDEWSTIRGKHDIVKK